MAPPIFLSWNMPSFGALLLGFVVRNPIEESYRERLERIHVVVQKKGPLDYNGSDIGYSAGRNPQDPNHVQSKLELRPTE